MDLKSISCISVFSNLQLFVTPWTVARQAPLSMGFPRQENWSGLSFSSPGDLPNPGIEPMSPVSPALVGLLFTTEPPGKPLDPQKYRPFTVSASTLEIPTLKHEQCR